MRLDRICPARRRTAFALERFVPVQGLAVAGNQPTEVLACNAANASRLTDVDRRNVKYGGRAENLTVVRVPGSWEIPVVCERLAAKKKEIAVMEAALEPGGQSMMYMEAPPAQDTPTEILGHGADAAPALVDVLERLGAL